MESESQGSSEVKAGTKNTPPTLGESETHNALLNDVVLQNIFKYLEYKDLKSCREVGNKTWLQNSKKAWWSQAKIVFQNVDELTDKIKDFLKETEIASNATNYKFEDFKGELGRFWERLGPSMKYLEFDCVTFQSVDHLRELLYTQCPNLEKLIFRSFRFTTYDWSGRVVEPLEWQNPQFGQQTSLKFLTVQYRSLQKPVSWMELLSHFPNLQAFEANDDYADIFQAISIIRQHDPKMRKLNHIKVNTLPGCGNQEGPIRAVLLDHNLSFETIDINAMRCQPDTVVDIFNLHAKSLKEVHIWGHRTPESLKLPSQTLDTLKELRFHMCLFPVDIFRYTPNLRKVSLSYNHIRKNESTTEPDFKVNTCKELNLISNSFWGERCDLGFDILLSFFPNVEALDAGGLNNRQFSTVCENLTKLVTFNCPYTRRLDVTGLLGYDPESQNYNVDRNSNITNLKGLESFSAVIYLNEKERKEACMRTGSIILKELESLIHLKKFELKDNKFKGGDQIWKEIFSKYSDQ